MHCCITITFNKQPRMFFQDSLFRYFFDPCLALKKFEDMAKRNQGQTPTQIFHIELAFRSLDIHHINRAVISKIKIKKICY